MARTIGQIYNALIEAKSNQSELEGLAPSQETFQNLRDDQENNPSTVAIWRIWLYVVAVMTHISDVLLDQYIVDVEEKIRVSRWGTLSFLQSESLKFQNGNSLVWNGSQFIYDPVIEANQIIKRASVVSSLNGILLFKVAKLDGNGDPDPLTVGEKSSFNAYVNNIIHAGTQFEIISEQSDDLKLELDVVFDPLVLNPDGSKIGDAAVFPVVDKINEFVGNLPFDGVINLTSLVDALQSVDGVVDPVLNDAFSKYGGLSYERIVKNVTPFAGHAKLNESDSIIIYISSVNV